MKQRAQIAMTEDEVAEFLRDSRKLQLGTINPDGTPHLVTMFYALTDGLISLWSYGKAQKTQNIRRDPRVTCLIEAGDDYFDLRGVMVYGKARLIEDPTEILQAGTAITLNMSGLDDPEPLREYVEHTARKRLAFLVEPTKIVSWDHRRLR